MTSLISPVYCAIFPGIMPETKQVCKSTWSLADKSFCEPKLSSECWDSALLSFCVISSGDGGVSITVICDSHRGVLSASDKFTSLSWISPHLTSSSLAVPLLEIEGRLGESGRDRTTRGSDRGVSSLLDTWNISLDPPGSSITDIWSSKVMWSGVSLSVLLFSENKQSCLWIDTKCKPTTTYYCLLYRYSVILDNHKP